MKLLVLSRYDRLGASSRVRMMQYLPFLEAAGFVPEVQPFFDDAYLLRLYRGARDISDATSYHLRRIGRLLRTGRPDVIWLEKEALPLLPFFLEQLFVPRGAPIVADYDDAVFHNYDLSRSRLVRGLLGSKIDKVMAHSALVMAGNAYLADRAHKAGASHISIVPTVVDADAYGRQLGGLPQSNPRSRIGWIGTPSTWHQYMVPMLPMLKDLALKHYAIVRVVGATVASDDVIEVLPWSESEESEMIQGMDVGLMPLDDSPWARGKCGYKIIQYMACGIPVVASPVGVNADIVQHGVTGFLASTDAEWREAIETLLGDSGLRQRMGEAGRRRMEEHYSLQTWAPRVAALLKEAAQGA